MNIFFLSLLLLVSNVSKNAHSSEFSNPYVDKNIDSHMHEFLAFEAVQDFHKSIELYNADEKNSLKIKMRKDRYELTEGKNKISFDVTLVTKGNFLYNGVQTNLRDQAVNGAVTLINIFMSDAYAATPVTVSKVMLAALLNIDEKFNSVSMFKTPGVNESNIQANWKNIKARIVKYQANCTQIRENVSAYGAKTKIESLMDVMNKQKGKENEVIEDALGVIGTDCTNQYERQRTGIGSQLYGRLDDKKAEAVEVCVSLQELKSCLINIPGYHMSDAPRSYLKEKANSSDDLKKYDGQTSGK